ncbi:hypothetical protein SPSYN_02455 [Sporotomaculum syntrophicum]|uniref:Uncharacterized protein n=1 Tax=Sporotomaculum syntrophicum TaxID=182264 RepID=A0A9D2WPR7_9FIRM|nr:hypothetical protein [Sporotomaculum syntrophicum]KAF1084676.1 hypothetical protein SPSYN_02455 [Sporotomaculum syntrophicum]
MKINQLPTIDENKMNAQAVLTHLQQLIREFQKSSIFAVQDNSYAAYLHGQIYGLALALRLLYPGPGNWGERAALLVRPVLTEHQCDCPEENH